MKKLSITISLLSLLSCEGPAGRDGIDGQDFKFYVQNFTVYSQDWKYVSTGGYTTLYQYIAEVDVKKEAYNYGIVEVYMFQWDTGNDSEVQTPLPYWTQHTADGNTWLEGFNYDFDEKTIAFFVEVRNGTNPPTSKFKIVIAP
ncbi:MAG: hypothetical protein LBD80_04610 [Tannerella sp.]|nr:hypothetical protein [Tannerella sp.]